MRVEGCPIGVIRHRLEFEATQWGLPIEYQSVCLEGFNPPQFQNRAVVAVHTSPTKETFGMRLGEHDVLVKAGATSIFENNQLVPLDRLLKAGCPVGYDGPDGEFVLLGYVFGHVLLVFVSLEDLANRNNILNTRSVNGSDPGPCNPLARVMDVVIGQAMPLLKENVSSYKWTREREAFINSQAGQVQIQIQRTTEEIISNDTRIRQLSTDMANLHRANRDKKEMLSILKERTQVVLTKRAGKTFDDLVGLMPNLVERIEFRPDGLMVYTHDVEPDGIWIGKFEIWIEFGKSDPRFKLVEGEERNGHPHPHINTSGYPCLGNMLDPVVKMSVEHRWVELISVLVDFLNSYNEEDPYVRLDYWDPDYVEERWEDCYSEASAFDCVECSSTDCTYYDDRHDRCYDSIYHNDDSIRCIRCQICGYHTEAASTCRDGSDLPTCISCDVDACPYYRRQEDMDQCQEESTPENCASCESRRCAHHPEREET